MTQEDKELLLKDLCARLPYGVKLHKTYEECNPLELCSLDIRNDKLVFYKYEGEVLTICDTDDIERFGQIKYKPYLFPLSSMTLEQRCKLRDLLPNNCDISFKNQKITFYDEGNIRLEQLEKIFHLFNLFHFDYRGLIPMGLAKDATGLNVY